MRITKEKLYLECVLTDAEKLRYGAEMAELLNKKSRAEDQLKSTSTAIKAEIAAHDAKINDLSGKISTGKERRDVECEINYDWDRKVKSWIRKDTGEVTKEDIIPERELQEELELKKLEDMKATDPIAEKVNAD